MRIVCACSSEIEFDRNETRGSSTLTAETEAILWWKRKHEKCSSAWREATLVAAQQPPAPVTTNYRLPADSAESAG